MKEDLAKLKIQALLHDPPEKAVILGKMRISHEKRALGLLEEILEEPSLPDNVIKADHIASAADRINLPKDKSFTADFLKEPVIAHPLSGKEFKLSALMDIDLNAILFSVQQSVVQISRQYGSDLEKNYLALWRELPELLENIKSGTSTLGRLWELLPADTRIPDHSIWEHRRITAALAGALPNPSFLLLSIGPVQDFIATARKTHDLWAGSYLLSYLSWKAMEVVCEQFGPDSIIFPDLFCQPFVDQWLKGKGLRQDYEVPNDILSCSSLPNRFFACVPEKSAEDMALKAQVAVETAFRDIAVQVRISLEKELEVDAEEWGEIWERQIKDFFEFSWAYLTPGNDWKKFLDKYKKMTDSKQEWPFNKFLAAYKKGFDINIGTLYGQLYRLTEKTSGSRKMLRDFRQKVEPHFKCTICGEREPLHPKSFEGKICSDFHSMRRFWQNKIATLFPVIKLSERLCSICTVKRFAARFYFNAHKKFNIRTNFPSTSIISTSVFKQKVLENWNTPEICAKAMNFIQQLENSFGAERCLGETLTMLAGQAKKIDGYAEKFARLEGDFLFEESLRQEVKDLQNLSRENEEAIMSSWKGLMKTLNDKNRKIQIPAPSNYYAVILMDGDHMGKWLSGEYAPEVQEILHPIIKKELGKDETWKDLLDKPRPLSPSLHLAVSRALRNFSLKIVHEIVEKDHLGKVIYSGGDDVLAFVSLRDLLPMMKKLRAFYSGNLSWDENKGIWQVDYENGTGFVPLDDKGNPINIGSSKAKPSGFVMTMGHRATASAGVVIAHHSSDLGSILAKARECEKKAKKSLGRDAFYIRLEKRSGEADEFGAKWHYNGLDSVFILEEWEKAFSEEGISPRFAHDFREGCLVLPSEAFKKEVERLVRRHSPNDFPEIRINELLGNLSNFFVKLNSLDKIASMLSLATFLGREAKR